MNGENEDENGGSERPAEDPPSRLDADESLGALPLEKLGEAERRYELADGESVVDAVLDVVSSVQECEPLDLPPLYEAIDPDTLEATWAGTTPAGVGRAVWCTFVFDRTLVTVASDGGIYAVSL